MSSFTDSLHGVALLTWQVFLWLAIVGAWLFPVLYAFTLPWWQTETGRHLITYSSVLAYALTAYALRLVYGDFPGRSALMFSTIILLAFVAWWRAFWFARKLIVNCKRKGVH